MTDHDRRGGDADDAVGFESLTFGAFGPPLTVAASVRRQALGTATRVVPIGALITTTTIDIDGDPWPISGVVVDHVAALNGEHPFVEILGPMPCSQCVTYPHAVYIRYERDCDRLLCGVHFLGEQDPRTTGRRITRVVASVAIDTRRRERA